MTIVVTKESELLRRAAEIIEENGWRQGWKADGDTVCVVDALAAAWRPWSPEVGWLLAADRVKDVLGLWVGTALHDWNDEPGRTKQEVLDAFNRAAQQAEEEGK
jgi:hypothetical protein